MSWSRCLLRTRGGRRGRPSEGWPRTPELGQEGGWAGLDRRGAPRRRGLGWWWGWPGRARSRRPPRPVHSLNTNRPQCLHWPDCIQTNNFPPDTELSISSSEEIIFVKVLIFNTTIWSVNMTQEFTAFFAGIDSDLISFTLYVFIPS